jgi:purine-binding chemotaxis protein CheW
MRAVGRTTAVIVRAGAQLCALRIADVVEVMRPLPIEPPRGATAGVLGVAIVRGAALPVVDLAQLLGAMAPTGEAGAAASAPPTRFVTVRAGARHLSLAVTAVVGVADLDAAELARLPPLVEGIDAGLIDQLGRLDAELVVVLAAGRVLPEAAWQGLDDPPGAAP